MENNNELGTETLEQRLNKATAHKTPGTHTPTPTVEPKITPEPKTEPTVKVSPWNSDDDFEKPKVKPAPSTDPADPDKTEPLSEKTKRASARTVCGMYDMSQKAIFIPALNRKYKKKFSEEEIDRLDKVADANKVHLSPDDFQLRSKWDNLMTKRDIKVKAVPMNREEKQDMEQMLYDYFDFTNTAISPAWGLVFAVVNTTGKRFIDVITD